MKPSCSWYNEVHTNLIETAQRARPARARPALKRAFVGCIHGRPSDPSGSGDEAAAREIVTADVLELGLSRGAIATRKLEGVMRDKEHEGLYWFGPLR